MHGDTAPPISLMTESASLRKTSIVGVGASVIDSYRMFMDELLGATKDPKAFARKLKEALDNGALDSSTVAQELEQIVPELMGKSTFFGKNLYL